MSQARVRVVVVGGTGMLGGMLVRRLTARGFVVRATQRQDSERSDFFDACDDGADVASLLSGNGGAELVINAAGVLKASIDEGDPRSVEAARAVNSRLPHRLARASEAVGARFIHVSTDAVLARAAAPLDESARPEPRDVYGRTKLEGEVRGAHALTLRCSIVGPSPLNGRSLYEWLRARPKGGVVRGFVDHAWNGVTTMQLADLCAVLTDRATFDRVTAVSPLRHFCPNAPVTKYELLEGLRAAMGLDLTVEPVASGAPVSLLLESRWGDLASMAPSPGWPQLLAELVASDPRRSVAQSSLN